MKKKIAHAVTVALLAFPLSAALTMADTTIPNTTASISTPTDTTLVLQAEAAVAAYEVGPITTLAEIATAEGLKATADKAVAEVDDLTTETAFEHRVKNRTAAIATAKTVLQAEAAVAAYEVGPITTLEEITKVEGLKAAAVRAVAEVDNLTTKTAFKLRVENRTAAVANAKTVLKAEAAVAAYEVGPITTLAEIAKAEGLKAAAVRAVATVDDGTTKTALELRITKRAATIATAKTTAAPVVDSNGNTVKPANWLTDFIGKLQLALTSDPAGKCELNERHALAKLAEAQKLMKAGKSEAAQICVNQYTDKIAKAQEFLDQVKDPTSETAKTLDKALVNVNSNNIQVLGNLLDKLPPQAAEKVALNVVRSMEKAVTKIEKEEAKATLETTSATKPVLTSVTDSKILKNKTKVALEDFKNSLNQKGKIHIEDQNEQDNRDKNVVEQSKHLTPQIQSSTLKQPIHLTVAPVKPQLSPTVTPSSEHNTGDRSTHREDEKNKGGDNKDNHRDKYVNR